MSAPHLPPYTHELIPRQTLQSLPWVLFVVGVAALTSIALTLATLVWLAPSVIPAELETRVRERSRDGSQASMLNPAVVNEARRRVWTIRDRRQKLDDLPAPAGFYPASAARYEMIMFSSDGWAVAYVPGFRPGLPASAGAERFWEVFNHLGQAYQIEHVFYDAVSSLTYIKLAGEGFAFASFADWDKVGPGSAVWLSAEAGRWLPFTLPQPAPLGSERRYRLTEPQWQYVLPGELKAGQIAIDEAGALIGFVGEEQTLIEGWLVENQSAAILGAGKTRYLSAPWSGQMAEGFISGDDGLVTRHVSGFYVSASPTRAASSTVGVGDVITHIQNQPVDPVTLPRRIFSAPERMAVTVWRNREEVDIVVEKKLEIRN